MGRFGAHAAFFGASPSKNPFSARLESRLAKPSTLTEPSSAGLVVWKQFVEWTCNFVGDPAQGSRGSLAAEIEACAGWIKGWPGDFGSLLSLDLDKRFEFTARENGHDPHLP